MRRAIAAHSFPGNVRELEHAIERAVIMSSGLAIEPEDLPPQIVGSAEAQSPVGVFETTAVSADEPERLRRALRRAGGSRTEAARLLGVSRTTLWRRLRRCGIDGSEQREV